MKPLLPHLTITLPADKNEKTRAFLLNVIAGFAGESLISDISDYRATDDFTELPSPDQVVVLARLRAWLEGGAATQDQNCALAEAAAVLWAVDQMKVAIDVAWDKGSKPGDFKGGAQAVLLAAREIGVDCPKKDFSVDPKGWGTAFEEMDDLLVCDFGVRHLPQVYLNEYVMAVFSLGYALHALRQLHEMFRDAFPRSAIDHRRNPAEVSPKRLAYLKRFFSEVNEEPLPSYDALLAAFKS
jgi:hypothetical protein